MAAGNVGAIKEKRDSLNSKVKELITTIKDDTSQLKALNDKLNQLKSKRDEEKTATLKAKKIRDDLNKKIGKLVEELKALQKGKDIKLEENIDLNKLKSEIKRLDMSLQKQELPVNKYNSLYDKLEQMQEKYKPDWVTFTTTI